MNIVIAGDGEVGTYLAKMLTGKDHNIIFISLQASLLETLESHSDLMTVQGDSTSLNLLKEANIKNTDLLISVLHDEKVNIITCLLGKKLGAKKVIARISSLEYLQEKNKEYFQTLGIDEIVCPERIAANECKDLISQTAATEIYDFSGGMLSLLLFHLGSDAKIIGITPKELYEKYSMSNDVKVLAIGRTHSAFIPENNEIFKDNDFVYTLMKPKGRQQWLDAIGTNNHKISNVMIVGGGRIAQMLVKELSHDINIKVIEIDSEKCELLAGQFNSNVLVIKGDAREVDVLEDENIRDMDVFVAITDNSETNIMTCLLAKRFGVSKVIALMDNVEYIDFAQRFGVDGIINKKLITASYMTRFTLDADVSNIKFLSGIDGEVLEVRAKQGSMITKKPIGHINLPYGVILGGVVRGYESHIATPDFQIREDDKVVFLCLPNTAESVLKLFNKKGLF